MLLDTRGDRRGAAAAAVIGRVGDDKAIGAERVLRGLDGLALG